MTDNFRRGLFGNKIPNNFLSMAKNRGKPMSEIHVNASGDGGVLAEVDNNGDHWPLLEKTFDKKKKTRGTRGGRKQREKKENREKAKKKEISGNSSETKHSPIKKELAPNSPIGKKLSDTKYTYDAKALIAIRKQYGTRLTPHMVLAPMDQAGTDIFPVEFVELDDVFDRLEETERKPFEGKTPYFVTKEKAKLVPRVQLYGDREFKVSSNLLPDIQSVEKWMEKRPENEAGLSEKTVQLVTAAEKGDENAVDDDRKKEEKVKHPMRPPKHTDSKTFEPKRNSSPIYPNYGHEQMWPMVEPNYGMCPYIIYGQPSPYMMQPVPVLVPSPGYVFPQIPEITSPMPSSGSGSTRASPVQMQ